MVPGKMINKDRLWNRLMQLSKIGATIKGGVCRLAIGKEDKLARDLFVDWCRQLDCQVRVDPVGNIFARRPGAEKDLAPVMTGSHLDTQPTGGKFDGAYGVLAGLEVIQTLNDNHIITKAPLEVVAWTNEEGSEFSPPMFGSSVYAGSLNLDTALAVTNSTGKSVGQALEQIGYAGQGHLRSYPVNAYFEAHIEQGPILEESKKTIGIVTAVQGLIWYDITLTGQAAHAGAAPMDRRRDALAASVELLRIFYDLAGNRFSPHGRATAGDLQLSPGARNTVPETVTIKIDMRHPNAQALEEMDRAVCQAATRITRNTGVDICMEKVAHTDPVAFDKECVSIVASVAQNQGMEAMKIISGAGHDAAQIARVIPSAMIFVPCLNGLSHNEAESASPEDLAQGCELLMGAILHRAGLV